MIRSIAGSIARPLAVAITGASGGAAPVDTYAANGFSPDYVADFSATDADYFRVAGVDSDFATAFTADSEGGGLATMVDSSGKLVLRAHNELAYSEQFDNAAWLKNNVSVTANADTAPDGTVTADLVTGLAGTAAKYIQQAVTAADFNRSAFACFKENTHRYIQIYGDADGNEFANFDLRDGSVGTEGSAVSGSTTALPNGYYLINIDVANATANNLRFALVDSLSAGYAAQTSSTGSVYVWGAGLYRSDLGGMADNPDPVATGLEKYVPTTTAARYLARRRHHRWNGSSWVPTCLHEPVGATNLDPNSDDLSAWTTSNTTIAKDQTGADGVANSAHSITATADSGTALEQITAASAAHAWGCLMKRITGTGTVEVTVDGGTTWVDVTSDLSTSVFLQVSTGAGITVTNPEFGVRLGTSGDVVAVQVSQLEQTSGFISSPIPTNGSTVTRTADTLKGKAASFPWSSTAVSMAIKGRHNRTSGVAATLLARYEDADDSLELRVDSSNNAEAYAETGGSSQTASGGAVATGAGAAYSLAMRYVAGSAIQVATGGTAGSEVTASVPATPPLSDDDVLILEGSGTGDVNGTVDRVIGWDEDIATAGLEETSA